MEIFKEFFEEMIIEMEMFRNSLETVGSWRSRKNDLPVPQNPCALAIFS